MNKIKDFIYGIIIGIANIIPGASGGTIAVITGIFDRLIDNIANVIKNPFKSVKNLLFIIIGVLVGLIASIFTIEKLIEVVPIPTFFFFSGLIIGSIPFLIKKISKENKSVSSWIIFSFSFLIIIGLTFLSGGQTKELGFNFTSFIVMFFLGMISLMAMILPGVSGSMIVASFGYYEPLINLISQTVKEVFSFNFTSNILLVLMFCIGALIGLVGFAKAIKFLLKKYFVNTFMCIVGLVSASSIAVIVLAIKDYGTKYILFGIITIIIGIISGYGLTKLDKKNDEKEE